MNDPSPAKLLPKAQGPRVILYHQTHHLPNGGPPVSLLPLITNETGITHLIIAAFHLNEDPKDITLNDTSPNHEKFNTLWAEVAWLQASSIKVLGMLGGAAKGTFAKLDGDDHQRFETYYLPLRDVILTHRLHGLDLDIEESMTTAGVVRLIDRLRSDFGPDFIITLAPVATALLPGQPHLSGFDYGHLERIRGPQIAWYNTQFYCGWGDASTTFWYDAIMQTGWEASKVVIGLITNPVLGAGYVEWPKIRSVLNSLRARYPTFGGVMGWEYFIALPGGQGKPWEWAEGIANTIRSTQPLILTQSPAQSSSSSVRPFGVPLPAPHHPYPVESVKALQELGFNQQQAITALNMTSGNVDQAAALLFAD